VGVGLRKKHAQKQAPIPISSARRRLFLIATALVARGMEPHDAYKTALYYAEGAGRGRTWIRALAEIDADRESQSERRRRDTFGDVAGDRPLLPISAVGQVQQQEYLTDRRSTHQQPEDSDLDDLKQLAHGGMAS